MKSCVCHIKSSLSLIALVLILQATFSALAQDTPQFKAGDRVEVDTLQSGDPTTSKYWRKGVIKEVSRDGMAYVVTLDPKQPGGRAEEITVPIRFPEKWVRPLPGPAKTSNASNRSPRSRSANSKNAIKTRGKSAVGTNNPGGRTASANRTAGKKRSRCDPSVTHYQAMIRENKEFQYRQTYDRVKTTFHEFKIGKAIRWTNPYGRAIKTTAYPVRARYRVEVWGGTKGDINHLWEYNSLIHFYVDTHGECTFDVVEGAGGNRVR